MSYDALSLFKTKLYPQLIEFMNSNAPEVRKIMPDDVTAWIFLKATFRTSLELRKDAVNGVVGPDTLDQAFEGLNIEFNSATDVTDNQLVFIQKWFKEIAGLFGYTPYNVE